MTRKLSVAARRICVAAFALLPAAAAIAASQPGYSTAGSSWHAPAMTVAAGTITPDGSSWH